jgi:hypothetical protein
MLFDFFDDVFLLNLPLKAAQRVLQRLSVLKSYFSQAINTPVSMRKMRPYTWEAGSRIVTHPIA